MMQLKYMSIHNHIQFLALKIELLGICLLFIILCCVILSYKYILVNIQIIPLFFCQLFPSKAFLFLYVVLVFFYLQTYSLFPVQPWGERIPVGKDNLILRECILKNTDYVEGLVVYAGQLASGLRIRILKIWSMRIRILDNKNKITKFFKKYLFYFFNI